jgi:hypothetical protein
MEHRIIYIAALHLSRRTSLVNCYKILRIKTRRLLLLLPVAKILQIKSSLVEALPRQQDTDILSIPTQYTTHTTKSLPTKNTETPM